MTSTTTNTNTLRLLPAELRFQIFRYQLEDFEWKGKMPSLVPALRGDLVVYHEALEAFHSRNLTYILSERNSWGFRDMARPMITTIGKVKIEVSRSLYPDRTLLAPTTKHDRNLHKRLDAKSQRRFNQKKQSPHIANRTDLRLASTALKNARDVTLHYPPNTIPTRRKTDMLDLYDFFIPFAKLRRVALCCSAVTIAEADLFCVNGWNLPGMGNGVFGVEGAAVRDFMVRCSCSQGHGHGNGHSAHVAWEKVWVWEAAEEGGFLDRATGRPRSVGFWEDTWILLKVTVGDVVGALLPRR